MVSLFQDTQLNPPSHDQLLWAEHALGRALEPDCCGASSERCDQKRPNTLLRSFEHVRCGAEVGLLSALIQVQCYRHALGITVNHKGWSFLALALKPSGLGKPGNLSLFWTPKAWTESAEKKPPPIAAHRRRRPPSLPRRARRRPVRGFGSGGERQWDLGLLHRRRGASRDVDVWTQRGGGRKLCFNILPCSRCFDHQSHKDSSQKFLQKRVS